MKILVSILMILLFGCSNQIKKKNEEILKTQKTTETVKIIEKSSEVYFTINNYKKLCDSVLSSIVGKKIISKMIIDTIRKKKVLFNELKNTPLENISKSGNIFSYTFLVQSQKSLNHTLIRFVFQNKKVADSVYKLCTEEALSKSSVPGLTYSNDVIIKYQDEIFWLNSKCTISYSNHLKFVSILKNIISKESESTIYCECGKVQCEIKKD